jgi:pyruvate dehydrogenase E2 component (dihydrolipoamide acetyltransferase)
MATDVIMPALGVAQQTGTLLKWFKSEGDRVAKGEPLMEVETDKATVEIEAAASGMLAQVTARSGDEIPVGQRIALILAPGENIPDSPRSLSSKPPEKRIDHPLPKGEETAEGQAIAARAAAMTSLPRVPGRILASPAAKRLAREKSIDLATVAGGGPEGAVLARDVLRVAQAAGAEAMPLTTAELRPLTPMRRIIGERMSRSKLTAPHFYLSMEVDMTRVLRARTDWKDRGTGPIPSLNDFVVHACARALKAHPALNSSYSESGIRLHEDIHIGMAVALEEGLVVPVVRHADRLGLPELAAATRTLTDKAQGKKLLPADYEGGTFTVSNLGMLGVDHFIAIINPPQCAILAVGRVAPRVVTDGDGIEIRSMMTVSLSADHRVVDGAIGARFLAELKRFLEQAKSEDGERSIAC